jgi:hypothetical protein
MLSGAASLVAIATRGLSSKGNLDVAYCNDETPGFSVVPWLLSVASRWVSTTGAAPAPQGEIGTLKEVRYEASHPTRVFIVIVHLGAEYVGCIMCDDEVLCARIANFLRGVYHRKIEEIGGLGFPAD